MPTGGKRAKREPVDDVDEEEGEEAEARLEEEFPINAEDGCAVPLVCRDASEYYSVMGVLFWSHYNSLEAGITRFFDTREACVLRLVHSEFREAVSATPWYDLRTIIKGSVASWRECFGLRVQAASVLGRKDLVYADFVHFRGLAALNMNSSDLNPVCWTPGCFFWDAAYSNLRGIGCLEMAQCVISVKAISHLKGVQEVNMRDCNLALVIASTESLQGVRSIKCLDKHNLMMAAISAGDVVECKRLLATRNVGSTSWLYAGVSFHDVSAPSSSGMIIATACVELLQVGIEVESAGILQEAVASIGVFILRDSNLVRVTEAVAVGAVPVLVAALRVHDSLDFLALFHLFQVLGEMASNNLGRVACVAANAVAAVMSSITYGHLPGPLDYPFSDFCKFLSRMAQTQTGTTACIEAGGVRHIVASLKRHAVEHPDEDPLTVSIAYNLPVGQWGRYQNAYIPACSALRAISMFGDGKAACFAENAVPCLLRLQRFIPYANDAKAALANLGIFSVTVC